MPMITRRQWLATPWLATGPMGTQAADTPAHAPARPALQVGPGRQFESVAAALRAAIDGDTIEVASGRYLGDVAVINQRRLQIRGVGERPVFAAEGRHAEGKAIWVVRDGDVQIENIAFQGTRVPDANGAGIRFEKGRLRLHRCQFIDNQMGLLTSNDGLSRLEVSDCEFADAPVNPQSLPHLLYVGRIAHFSLHNSLLRAGRQGHLVKSRARESVLVGNRLDDGLTGQASYEVDLPNGGLALLEGNTLVQSPLTQNAAMVSFGAEGQPWPDSRLTLRGNTLVNHRRAGGVFVRVWHERLPEASAVLSQHNQYLGAGTLALGPWGRQEGDRLGPVA